MNRRLPALALALSLAVCGEEPASDSTPRGATPAVGGEVEATGAAPVELAHFPLDAGAVPVGRDAVLDARVSRDGAGSLRVETEHGGRLRLYQLDDVGPVEGRLVYTGYLKSENLRGMAFLEMWCRPAEGDPAFVRGVRRPVVGSSDWTPQLIGFTSPDLCQGPLSIELNLVIEGAGTVWIDDLRLWSVPPD